MLRVIRGSILFQTALLSAFSIAHAQTSQVDNRPRTASISGRVTIGGKAAANAKIVITEIKDGPGPENQGFALALSGMNAGEDYAVLTDAEGNYRVANLPEGRYQAQAMLKGFVRDKPSQNEGLLESFSLKEGESRESVDFTLVRGGVITGRVTTADGRPLIAGAITLQAVDEQGRKKDARSPQNMMDMLMNSSMYQTDDRGVYRIFGLRAGRYLVSAGGDSNSPIGLLAGAGAALTRTWHPDAFDENQATIIEVDAGSEVTGIDIRLSSADRTYEALGRVIDDETGNPIAGVNVFCVKIRVGNEVVANGGFAGNTKSDEQGNFRLGGLSSGEYQLSIVDYNAVLTGGGGDHYSDRVKFEIQSADVSGVEIRTKRGATISGVAVVEDSGPSAKTNLAQMMIIAQSFPVSRNEGDGNVAAFSFLSPVIARIGGDGGFILKGVRPGKVSLQASGMTGGALKILRIERDGVDFSDGIPVTGRENITGVRIILGR